MKKILLTLGIALALTVSSWTGRAEARNPECRYGTGVKAMHQTIWCVTHKLDTGPAFRRYAMYVAERESRFDAHATNAYSGACGIFQHIPRYWPDRFYTYRAPHRFGSMGSSCYNGRTNVIVTLLMAKRGGWGPWGG